MQAAVELRKVSKFFSGVRALQDVSLQAFGGQCLGLVGENGAGKSTLMKILSGVWPEKSFDGEIFIGGKKKTFQNPADAKNAGIAIIHQELSLFPELSVAENIFMGQIPSHSGLIDHKKLHAQTKKILEELEFKILPEEKVKNLSLGEQQMIEIARAFTFDVKVVIFDEPTSALSQRETELLFSFIRSLKKRNVACIYISHKLPEIHELCERVTVLRDGQWIADFERNDFSDEKFIEAMVGRTIGNVFPLKRPYNEERETILSIRNLSVVDSSATKILNNIHLDLKKGEILGIAGLMGSGRSELLYTLFGGILGAETSGDLKLNGKSFLAENPREAIHHRFALLTEDRKANGLVLSMDVKSNMTFSSLGKISVKGIIQDDQEEDLVNYYRKLLWIKTPSNDFQVAHLSGGNQQKVILGRWLSTAPEILLLDEPTRGVDVGAKTEIYHLIRSLVDQGLSIILVSSELPEIVSLCDRVLVMKEGEIAALLEGNEISQETIMKKATAA